MRTIVVWDSLHFLITRSAGFIYWEDHHLDYQVNLHLIFTHEGNNNNTDKVLEAGHFRIVVSRLSKQESQLSLSAVHVFGEVTVNSQIRVRWVSHS